jgi:hypothetical protein
MHGSFGVEVEAHDLATVIDAGGFSERGARRIDRREDASVQKKTVDCLFGIGVGAHDLAAVVDVEVHGGISHRSDGFPHAWEGVPCLILG